MDKRGFVILFIAIFMCIGFGSASFVVDQNLSSIKKVYALGDVIGGSISITLKNESADSIITTNFGGRYTLRQWLDLAGKQKNKDFSCSSSACTSSYTSIGNADELSVSLSDSRVAGFSLSGNNVSVKSISFKFQSNLPNSCSKQFSIGAFDEDKYSLENYITSGGVCSDIKKGCFDSSLEPNQYQYANLTSNQYCELISLSPAPAYKLGSVVSGPLGPLKEKISMKLYDKDFSILYGTCDLPISGETQECTLNYPITEESNYYVCIASNSSSSPYQIRTEQREDRCGTTGTIKTEQSTIDFDIFAQPMEYASSQILFDYDKFALLNNEENFTKVANKYLEEKYSSSCLSNECYLPFKVVGQSQIVSFTEGAVVYESDGVVKTQTSIVGLEEDAGTISSERISVSLDKLNIPINKKVTTLEITLDGKRLLRTNIDVKPAQIEISPGFALIGVPTNFEIESNLSISSATWKFSDSSEVKNGLKVVKSFSKAGEYNVEVSAITPNGTEVSRTRKIVVGEPSASAKEIVAKTEESIKSISSKISTYPLWIRNSIETDLDLVKANVSLTEIKSKLAVAKTDNEYITIIGEVQALNVPDSIGTTKTGKFPIILGYNSINLEYAREIQDGNFDDAQFRAALTEWVRENYNAEIEIETIGAGFSSGSEAILTRVKVITNPIFESGQQRYFIINAPIETLHFSTGYSEKEISGGSYLPLENGQQTIEFYYDGDASIETLGMYILPSLSELSAGGYSYEIVGSNEGMRSRFIYISIIVLILLIIGATFWLQYWYRHNYEKHLFKREEELYNIMTFAYNSQKSGLREGDIRKKLLGAGWTREQISYAIGKLKGRILGLFGLPIYSHREEKKVREAIETRQKFRK